MGQQSNDSASSFATKSEISCFKLKGEDYHFVHTSERAEGSIDGCIVSAHYVIVGVLDGHGGKKAAEFSSKQVPCVFSLLLHERLPSVLENLNMEPYWKMTHFSEEQKRVWALQDAVVQAAPAALRDTFIKVHDDFLAKDMDSGTTATAVVLCGSQVITANVGDSLAYADLGTRVQQLTTSHRIDENAAEQRRIESSGGELGQAALEGKPCGPLRVWPGGLAFSRSLGDRHAGARVLAEPEVSQLLLDKHGARIILASDGLWDVLTGKNAAHRVRTVAFSKAAARLRSVAKDQRDRDDITVIVLDALDGPNARIPAALESATEARRPDAASVHQLWHPLTCSEQRWKDQWTSIMQARCPDDSEMTQSSDQEASASTQETMSEQTTIPARLYEQVRSITSSLNMQAPEEGWTAVQAPEDEWITVTSHHASSRTQAQQSRQNSLQEDASTLVHGSHVAEKKTGSEERIPKRNQGGTRGRGRGRGQGRGRGRNSTDMVASAATSYSTLGNEAGVANMESAGVSKPFGSDNPQRQSAKPEKRRQGGRGGRHSRRKGHASYTSAEDPTEKRVSVQHRERWE